MHEEIVGIIREVCGKDIDEDMSLFGDLQMDSVEMIELVLRIEEKYLFSLENRITYFITLHNHYLHSTNFPSLSSLSTA